MTERRERYRAILAGDRCLRCASVFDPISARMAEDLGFESGILSGHFTSAVSLGAPDMGLLTLTELAHQVRLICRASALSLAVDADSGYGNALNVMRTVEELETAGAAAVIIGDSMGDTLLSPTFGDANRRELGSLEEGVGRMKAALAARQDSSLVIVARTRAYQTAGLPEMVRRFKAFEQAGVDALWLIGPKTQSEVVKVHEAIRTPIILGSGASNDLIGWDFLAANGIRIASQGHLAYQASMKATYDTLKALRDGASPAALRPNLISPELLIQFTRQADYDRWIGEYLN